MHGTESNPYSAPSDTISSPLPRRKLSVRALFRNLIFTLIYSLAFFFVGASIGSGFASGWRYTHQMISDFPDLVVTMLLSYALLRYMILPPAPPKHVWMPILSGIASFHLFPWYWEYCDQLIQASLPPTWTDLMHESLMGVVPACVGIGIEGSMQVLNLTVTKARRAVVA